MDPYEFDNISGVTPIEDVFYERPNYNSTQPAPIRGYSRPTYNDRYDKPFAQPQAYPPPPPNRRSIYQGSYLDEPPKPRITSSSVAPACDPSKLSCQDIAKHIKDCPICSSVYRRYDMYYIVGIIILLLIIFLLVRKIMI